MFLDYWLLEIEKIGEGWLIFLLFGGGIVSGFYFFRLRKVLFPLLTFLVVMGGGGITRGIEKSNSETFSFSGDKASFFIFLFLALFLAGVVASKKENAGEILFWFLVERQPLLSFNRDLFFGRAVALFGSSFFYGGAFFFPTFCASFPEQKSSKFLKLFSGELSSGSCLPSGVV